MRNTTQAVTDHLIKSGYKIHGVAYKPLRIDFSEKGQDENAAYKLAEEVIKTPQLFTVPEPVITPEKVQILVDLLLAKGILTQEEINSL